MNKFISTKNNAPQAEKHQMYKSIYQEFEANKKYIERFVADCVIAVMEG